MSTDVEILIGPLHQVLEILELNGIELQALTQYDKTEN